MEVDGHCAVCIDDGVFGKDYFKSGADFDAYVIRSLYCSFVLGIGDDDFVTAGNFSVVCRRVDCYRSSYVVRFKLLLGAVVVIERGSFESVGRKLFADTEHLFGAAFIQYKAIRTHRAHDADGIFIGFGNFAERIADSYYIFADGIRFKCRRIDSALIEGNFFLIENRFLR